MHASDQLRNPENILWDKDLDPKMKANGIFCWHIFEYQSTAAVKKRVMKIMAKEAQSDGLHDVTKAIRKA